MCACNMYLTCIFVTFVGGGSGLVVVGLVVVAALELVDTIEEQ